MLLWHGLLLQKRCDKEGLLTFTVKAEGKEKVELGKGLQSWSCSCHAFTACMHQVVAALAGVCVVDTRICKLQPLKVVCSSAIAQMYEADQRLACVDTYKTIVDGAAVQTSVTRMQVPFLRAAQSFTASPNKQLGNLAKVEQAQPHVTLLVALPRPDSYVADVDPQAPPVQEGAQMPSRQAAERFAEGCIRSSPEPEMVRTK